MRFTCSRDTDCFLLQAAAKALHMLHQVKQTACGFSPRACNPKLDAAGHVSPACYASVGLSGARRALGRACVFMTKGPCCTTGSPMGRRVRVRGDALRWLRRWQRAHLTALAW